MNFEFDTTRQAIPQGDCILVPIVAIPVEAMDKSLPAENGVYIVTHSESSHHHVVMERPTVKMFSAMDTFRDFLLVEDEPAKLEHLREHHTHETQTIPVGAWLIQRQRQPSPEGWQRAAD